MFQVLERMFQVFERTFQVLERKILRGAGKKAPCRKEFFCPFSEKILRCPIFPSLWFSIPIGLGYLVVFIIMAILLVRLFRK